MATRWQRRPPWMNRAADGDWPSQDHSTTRVTAPPGQFGRGLSRRRLYKRQVVLRDIRRPASFGPRGPLAIDDASGHTPGRGGVVDGLAQRLQEHPGVDERLDGADHSRPGAAQRVESDHDHGVPVWTEQNGATAPILQNVRSEVSE